ncbi:MAG: ligase-associated DNA damage response endonuclease PdeM [Siculibacillus sp.]
MTGQAVSVQARFEAEAMNRACGPLPGSLKVSVAGADLVFTREAALWWPEEATLVVSDLHLEKGSAHAARGLFLPPYDTTATLRGVGALVHALAPRRVISLGDSFHDADGGARLPEPARETLRGLQAGRDWIWIAGNHDPVIDGDVGGDASLEVSIGTLTFRHEPRDGEAAGEVAGHLHPAARVRVRGRSIRKPAFITDGTRLVMPAFGAFTGGLDVKSAPFAPLFPNGRFHAYLCGEDRLYAFPSRALSGG